MGITHVLRGEDHLMNTPKHLQLIEAFGRAAPQYAHIPLILNPDGSKMSKRDAGAAVGDYPRQGFLPAAVVNFIALLGWSPKSDEEIFDPAALIERFSLEAVNRAPARFDFDKCRWVNQQHLLRLDPAEFAARAADFVSGAGLPVPENFPAIAAAVKDRVRLLGEVPGEVDFLLRDGFDYDPEGLAKVAANAAAAELLAKLAAALVAMPEPADGEAAKEALKGIAAQLGVKPGALMFPLRLALSGRPHGLDLGQLMVLLGRERCVARVRALVGRL
jgi:glutamyl-tRNA synthetase